MFLSNHSNVVAQRNSVSLQSDVHCMFSQIETLVKLWLTITDAERSCLRRLKTYFRNSVNQDRLNHVTVRRGLGLYSDERSPMILSENVTHDAESLAHFRKGAARW